MQHKPVVLCDMHTDIHGLLYEISVSDQKSACAETLHDGMPSLSMQQDLIVCLRQMPQLHLLSASPRQDLCLFTVCHQHLTHTCPILPRCMHAVPAQHVSCWQQSQNAAASFAPHGFFLAEAPFLQHSAFASARLQCNALTFSFARLSMQLVYCCMLSCQEASAACVAVMHCPHKR